MAELTLRADLIQRLQELAQQEHQPIDELVENLLLAHQPLSDNPAPATHPDQLRQDRLRAYERARRYWQSTPDARQQLTDEQLDEQFWLFNENGVPRLNSDKPIVSLPPNPLEAMLDTVALDPARWSFGSHNISERSREILQNEFADYLQARMKRPVENSDE